MIAVAGVLIKAKIRLCAPGGQSNRQIELAVFAKFKKYAPAGKARDNASAASRLRLRRLRGSDDVRRARVDPIFPAHIRLNAHETQPSVEFLDPTGRADAARETLAVARKSSHLSGAMTGAAG